MATSGNLPLLGFESGAPGSVILLGFGSGGDAPTPPGDTTTAYTQTYVVVAAVQRLDFLVKDPDAIKPIGVDWSAWLSDLGDDVTISSSTWSASGVGLDLDEDGIVTGAEKTQVKMSGGVLGRTYRVTNHIVATSGDEDDRSFRVLIQEL